ncbi:unnamed protein product [Lepeophtheirus salmonis]|uniref:(salmon louse) hypothetical protein n=1 Tax=Lepeophtheirus salmonis TaxID=72036 RepID=A0A7R8CJ88_LEPSM|nr:unnamed protein product [Lepeophtheirus salmonis]CAF2836773.1 unnamed protein product [Lepeophtheirus salmonis]
MVSNGAVEEHSIGFTDWKEFDLWKRNCKVENRTSFHEFEEKLRKKLELPIQIESNMTRTVYGYDSVSDEDEPEYSMENIEAVSTNPEGLNVGTQATQTHSDLQDKLSDKYEIRMWGVAYHLEALLQDTFEIKFKGHVIKSAKLDRFWSPMISGEILNNTPYCRDFTLTIIQFL